MQVTRSYRKFYYMLSVLTESSGEVKPSDKPIDVIIPAVEKDLRILPLCIEAVRRFVTNKIGAIYLVAPNTDKMQKVSSIYNLIFIDETTVLGYNSKKINYVLRDGRDRSGWIFQQLLKLSGNIGTCSHYLVIDADHILIRPHVFLSVDEKTVFYRSREFHFPYYEAIRKLLGKEQISVLSYVAHKMLFSCEILENLKKKIYDNTGRPWDEAILELLDIDQISCFSEYEMYGNYFPAERAKYRIFCNKSFDYREIASLDDLVLKYSRRYRAVTFPDYKNE